MYSKSFAHLWCRRRRLCFFSLNAKGRKFVVAACIASRWTCTRALGRPAIRRSIYRSVALAPCDGSIVAIVGDGTEKNRQKGPSSLCASTSDTLSITYSLSHTHTHTERERERERERETTTTDDDGLHSVTIDEQRQGRTNHALKHVST
jgi:hypothetical protein